jgi:CheY-like chemotaxis protein
MDAMAAARAAAEAALYEEANQDMGGGQHDQALYDPPPQAAQHMMGGGHEFAADQQYFEMLQQESQQQQQQGLNANLLQDLLGSSAGVKGGHAASSTDQLLHLLAQQQQHGTNSQQHHRQAPSFEPEPPMAPGEHYMTIAQDGRCCRGRLRLGGQQRPYDSLGSHPHRVTLFALCLLTGSILEATDTVTGFPANSLLMTSTFDTIYDDDLPGFLCIKTQFWDQQRPAVDAFIRRRTIDGDWVWLASRAVSYVSHPIPGVVIVEKFVDDEVVAQKVNRIVRIAAILIQAVEAANLTLGDAAVAAAAADVEVPPVEQVPQETELSQALRASLEAGATQFLQDQDVVQELLQIAKGAVSQGPQSASENTLERDLMEMSKQQQKGFDPFQMMESVRKGVRLDLGLTQLEPEEMKLLALVLSGIVLVEEVAPLVLAALQSNQGLANALSAYRLDGEKERNSHRRAAGMHARQPSPRSMPKSTPPAVSVLNLSYTYIGNTGIELLSEVLHSPGNVMKTLDLSFCRIEEKGFLSLAKALTRRKKKEIDPLLCLILSGNHITPRAASEVGASLAVASRSSSKRTKRTRHVVSAGGYETDSSDDEDDEEEDEISSSYGGKSSKRSRSKGNGEKRESLGIHVLHLAHVSLTPKALGRLLDGLGSACTVRELNLSSNNLGAPGAVALVQFLEGQARSRDVVAPFPFLDRMDMSNNNLGDEGTTQLTRVVYGRSQVHFVDLRLSSNAITAGGVETFMNKLLQHDLISLSLDKNAIGDQGCKLVAASLQSMKCLSRLNLSFNQISSRGITSLMRSLIACESITFLGLSGNILKISGAVALAFTLSQHPRLEELHLDNCCLGQAAQCHIAAGIISNRWVPMKRMKGYAVGPPMVAIGALQPYAQNLSNEECFRIRKDEQMKTMLQWMETNRIAKKSGQDTSAFQRGPDSSDVKFLTPEFVESINEVGGAPSQNSYFRLLGWLGRIPFDDDELTSLQKYFYDTDGGEGDRGSDGYINLKLRGDLLAALDSEVADEIRDELPTLSPALQGSVGFDMDKLDDDDGYADWSAWDAFCGRVADKPAKYVEIAEDRNDVQTLDIYRDNPDAGGLSGQSEGESDVEDAKPMQREHLTHSKSLGSVSDKEKKSIRPKARITMFPEFEQQLERLKATAAEMIEQEDDPMHHEVILTQYAEASLTVLRQLKYRCMQSGYDGWRQGSHKRKILVVDDSLLTRKMIARAFEKANFIVDTATNGQEGVEKLKASIYDIAFMDIQMPVMNGFEATKKLRDWEDKMRPGARQPICALTATYVDDFERSELMKFKEAGLDVMESKPCNIPRLFKVVDDVSPMFSDLSISVNSTGAITD